MFKIEIGKVKNNLNDQINEVNLITSMKSYTKAGHLSAKV